MKLTLKDTGNLSKTYYIDLKVTPAGNIGPPRFMPFLESEPLRIALGEKNISYLPLIVDPDIEDTNPSISFS